MQFKNQPTRRRFLQALPATLVLGANPGLTTIGAAAQTLSPARFSLKEIQGALRTFGVDGWLFYDICKGRSGKYRAAVFACPAFSKQPRRSKIGRGGRRTITKHDNSTRDFRLLFISEVTNGT